MIAYYLRLALISMRTHWLVSALMVAAIALGIGACMTVLTVNYVMGSDPIPHKSDALYYVRLDSWDPNRGVDERAEPPDQVTYLDAMALMKAGRAHRQTANAGAALVVEPEGEGNKPFIARARANFADFFPMFDVPFRYGGSWDAAADNNRQRVVVLSKATNERLFGGENSVGRTLRMDKRLFRVAGVLDDWNPVPRFYDVTSSPFDAVEDVFIPFNLISELNLNRSGNTNCWKPTEGDGLQAFLNSECIWIQFWAELRDDAERDDYLHYLNNYTQEQRAFGRFQRPLNNRLDTVMDWMDNRQVVAKEAQMLLAVAAMFLAVCLLNTIGLLLSKFLGKAPEIGLRRALGASRSTLFYQYLVESGCIGIAGGVLGLGLTWLGLRGLDALFGDVIENLIRLDGVMMATAVGLAIASSIAAGLYPTWRACNVQPAGQLKAQ